MDDESKSEAEWYNSLSFGQQMAYTEVRKYGCPSDYYNEWLGFVALRPQDLDVLRIIPTFEEYVNRKQNWDQAFKDLILKNSDPAKVAQLNALAAEFNADLERIKQEKDAETVHNFYRRAMAIMRENKK